jgi:hypothetical protein
MVSSSIISSDETTTHLTASPSLGLVANRPLRVCSCRTYSSLPSGLRKMAREKPSGQFLGLIVMSH